MTTPAKVIEFEDETPAATVHPEAQDVLSTAKRKSEYFAAVRDRGFLNAGLDSVTKAYDADHPGRKAKWEYYNPKVDGGTDMAQHREAMGFEFVDSGEVNLGSGPSAQKEGPLRRGDLILMSAPIDVVNAIRLQDATAAHEDLQAPKKAFEDSVAKNTVRKSDGTVEAATTFGKIKQTVEEVGKVAPTVDE